MRGCAGAGLGIEKPKLTLGPPVAEAAAPDALAPDAAALGGKFGIGRLRGIASSKPRRGATRLRMASEASSRRDTIGEATGSSRLANPFPTACTGLVDAILPMMGGSTTLATAPMPASGKPLVSESRAAAPPRSEEHTSELQSLMR